MSARRDPTPPPRRTRDAHKASVGRVLVVGGAPGMTGAPFLAGWGALRAGAGLVRVAVPAPLVVYVTRYGPELLTAALPAARDGTLARRALPQVLALAQAADAVVLGPGAGRTPATQRLLLELARSLDVPLVMDADALFALAVHPQALRGRKAPTVLTPHEAEAARILGRSAREVKADREGAAHRLATTTGATVVLKGPGTLVVPAPGTPGRAYRCTHGGPLLATGGTGDVLAGVLGALLAQEGLAQAGRARGPGDATRAAQRAVRWHAGAGDLLATEHGVDRGITAREVADALPAALAVWRRTR